jgi:hypothetical protein
MQFQRRRRWIQAEVKTSPSRIRRPIRRYGPTAPDPWIARGVPETGQWSCCAFVFVDQATDDIAAVDLFGSWRSRHALAL